MILTDKYENLPEVLREGFQDLSDEQIMDAILAGFITLVHRTNEGSRDFGFKSENKTWTLVDEMKCAAKGVELSVNLMGASLS